MDLGICQRPSVSLRARATAWALTEQRGCRVAGQRALFSMSVSGAEQTPPSTGHVGRAGPRGSLGWGLSCLLLCAYCFLLVDLCRYSRVLNGSHRLLRVRWQCRRVVVFCSWGGPWMDTRPHLTVLGCVPSLQLASAFCVFRIFLSLGLLRSSIFPSEFVIFLVKPVSLRAQLAWVGRRPGLLATRASPGPRHRHWFLRGLEFRIRSGCLKAGSW